jgi:hypothetical protein
MHIKSIAHNSIALPALEQSFDLALMPIMTQKSAPSELVRE